MTRRSRLRLIQPSTRAFAREGRRLPGYSLFDWLHGYVYARWPYTYIGLGTGEHPLSPVLQALVRALSRVIPGLRPGKATSPDQAAFADTYHGKVVPLESATKLVTVRQDIRLLNPIIAPTKPATSKDNVFRDCIGRLLMIGRRSGNLSPWHGFDLHTSLVLRITAFKQPRRYSPRAAVALITSVATLMISGGRALASATIRATRSPSTSSTSMCCFFASAMKPGSCIAA